MRRERLLDLSALSPRQYRRVENACDGCNPTGVRAQVVVLAACARGRIAHEESDHGDFTRALLAAWNDGFSGSYDDLIAAVGDRMPADQAPVIRTLGAGENLRPLRALRP